MRKKLFPDGLFWENKIKILRKRPMCWGAIGFLLIIFTFLLGRSYREVLYQDETGKIILEGKITDKQYKESSYGGYWQITLKSVSVYRQQESESWSVEQREKRGGLPEEKYLII